MSATEAVTDVALDVFRAAYLATDREEAIEMFTFDLRAYDMHAQWMITAVDVEMTELVIRDDDDNRVATVPKFKVQLMARMIDPDGEDD